MGVHHLVAEAPLVAQPKSGLWRVTRLAQDATDSLDASIEDEELTGMVEAVEVRKVLERVQNLSLEISEELDAYQQRHGGQ
jgi:hypothetical protein